MEKQGIGHGISIFIAINIAENLIWHLFSPITISENEANPAFEGIFINLVHKLFSEDFMTAIIDAFTREKAFNIMNLLSTILIILIVLYFEGWYTNISFSNKIDTKRIDKDNAFKIKVL